MEGRKERWKKGKKTREEDRWVNPSPPPYIGRPAFIITKFQNHRHENILKASSKKSKNLKTENKTINQSYK